MAMQTVNQSLSSEEIDNIDELSRKTGQLAALLYMAHGEGGDVFRRSSEMVQENFLWACSDIASDANRLAQKLAGS